MIAPSSDAVIIVATESASVTGRISPRSIPLATTRRVSPYQPSIALRARARKAMDGWYGLTRRVVAKGIERGEIRPVTDADSVATMMTASLEGAIMMSKLYGDSTYIRRAVE